MAQPTSRIPKSLLVLREQLNKAYPGRKKTHDGWIGDPAHAARESDHNPDPDGTVDALDITHDPKSGCDSQQIAEVMRQQRDRRIKYLISNWRICGDENYAKRSGKKPWTWYKYNGKNGHVAHMHISVNDAFQDDSTPWTFRAVDSMQRNIIATIWEDVIGAYGPLDHSVPLVSLPAHFPRSNLPLVRVHGPLGSAVGRVADFGPSGWKESKGRKFLDDPYWASGARPRAETDKTSNGAGIDLNRKMAALIGIKGKGKVDWEFD